MRSSAVRSTGPIVAALAALLSILVNTMPAQATFVYSTDIRNTDRNISGSGIPIERPATILADFDVTRRASFGFNSSGMEKFVEVSQQSTLQPDRIEIRSAFNLNNPIGVSAGPGFLTALVIARVEFTLDQAVEYSAQVGPTSFSGIGAGSGVSLSRSTTTGSVFIFANGFGDVQSHQGILEPGEYSLSASASINSAAVGAYTATTGLTLVIPGVPTALAAVPAGALLAGRSRRSKA